VVQKGWKGAAMKILQYYADSMYKCPRCGSIDFHELWIGANEYAELDQIVCKRCGQDYPSKERFIRTQRDTNPVAQWLDRIDSLNIPF